ncbi:MAG: TraC family protein [Inquilinus sp.]|uniref:TraC family protein n=1 Tax=Inquilinus sp. TaxID=1932117 RepID=UPI003F3D044E
MARVTLVQKRAKQLEKLRALQAEIEGLEKKAALRLGDLAVRAGLADLDLSDATLLREFRAIAARLAKEPGRESAKLQPSGAVSAADDSA